MDLDRINIIHKQIVALDWLSFGLRQTFAIAFLISLMLVSSRL
jgi:hypothetical protein